MTPTEKTLLPSAAYSVTQDDGTPIPQPELAPEKGIGKRIKEARERPENGLSVEALSRLCKLIDPVGQGISHQTLVKYEKGIVLPGSRELRILSDALAVSADWLIFGVERGGCSYRVGGNAQGSHGCKKPDQAHSPAS
jgi:hypothetical protein